MEPTAKYKRGVIITLSDGLNAYLKADQPGDGETAEAAEFTQLVERAKGELESMRDGVKPNGFKGLKELTNRIRQQPKETRAYMALRLSERLSQAVEYSVLSAFFVLLDSVK